MAASYVVMPELKCVNSHFFSKNKKVPENDEILWDYVID